jgi:membrane protease YdiL (CAAX protease family)
MDNHSSMAARTFKLVGLGLLAFAITIFAGGIWSALLVVNLQSTPRVPWSVPVMAVLLWLTWRYLGGEGWPRSNSQNRRFYLRANSVATRTYVWAWIAGGLALIAFGGYWIMFFQLVKMPANTFSDMSAFPRITVALMIAMGSLVAPLMEEAGFRGYFQVALERQYRAPFAVVISAFVFSLAHGPTQGFVWPKLLFYFLVGVVFGIIAYLTNSTLPAIPVHIAGLLIFFTLIWPRDASRRLAADGGADKWFWIHVTQAVIFTILTVWALWHLSKARTLDPRSIAGPTRSKYSSAR